MRTRICLALVVSLILGITCIAPGANAALQFISIATGGSGGTYFIIGSGIGKIIEKYVPNVRVSVESTAASTENCRLVAAKKVTFAIVMPDSAYFAYNGGREFGSNKYPNVRAVMAGHTSTMHFMVKAGSGIKSLADCRGKRVALSAPGSPSSYIAEAALAAYGLSKSDYRPMLLTYDEQATGLRDNTIDMGCVFAGLPASAALDISSTHDITFLGLGPEQLQEVVTKYPYWTKGKIPPNTYRGQKNVVNTITSPAILITHSAVDSNLVYNVAKAIMEHTAELAAIHPQGAEYDLEDAMDGVAIPFHPGAEKYLREKGKAK